MNRHHVNLLRVLAGVLLIGIVSTAVASSVSSRQPLVNSLGMRFVALPGTNVLMSIWETRVQDFQTYLATSGQKTSPLPRGLSPLHPASNLSWYDAVGFCRWLTRHERALGRIGPEDRYRLPMDREWDLAVGPTRYPWGAKWPPPEVASIGYRPEEGSNTAPVGSSQPNALGVYDLAGNVFEWCQDWYERRMNPVEIRIEYKRLEDDGGGIKFKVLRGASWVLRDPMNLLSSYRYIGTPETRGGLYGFRCVLEIDPASRVRLGNSSVPTSGSAATLRLPVVPAATGPSAEATPALRRGRAVFIGACSNCHQLFDPVSYDARSWNELLNSMRGKAKLGPNDYADLQGFLSTVRTEDASSRDGTNPQSAGNRPAR